jgi:hypothetical protein
LHRAQLLSVTRVRGWISAGNCKALHRGPLRTSRC